MPVGYEVVWLGWNNTDARHMPAAAFVAAVALQEANQAAHIAHHAASMAEQQAAEAHRARYIAAQAEEHANQVQSQNHGTAVAAFFGAHILRASHL